MAIIVWYFSDVYVSLAQTTKTIIIYLAQTMTTDIIYFAQTQDNLCNLFD